MPRNLELPGNQPKWIFHSGSETAPNMPAVMQTTMSSPLPPEIFDLIVDFLHDEPDALKACCLVSKSWVHRTRKHLFAQVKFASKYPFKLWQKTFPDPSDSPAHYARSLSIRMSEAVTPADTGAGNWIRAFSDVIRLKLAIVHIDPSLAPLHGLSPTLKSLHVHHGSSLRLSEIFGLVCSFPLLEDLTLISSNFNYEVDEWNVPSASPKLTGCLDLRPTRSILPVVHRLLELPSGLHFSKISMWYSREDVELMTELVSKCSDTLESLNIRYRCLGAIFFFGFTVCQHLIAICEYSHG